MQKKYIMTAEDMIYKLYSFFNVNNNLDLADSIKTTPQTISNWKSRNSVNAIKKRCRELGIYSEIFGDLNFSSNENQKNENIDYSRNNASQNIMKSEPNIDKNILKLVDTLCSFAKTNNKFDELKKDLSSLLPKYM